MNWELDSILEQSITQIAEGKARVESCLLAYPAYADDLRPLLSVSEAMLAMPKPAISPQAKARIEGQLFEAGMAMGLVRKERKPLPRPRFLLPRLTLPRWHWAYGALAAMVIVVLFMATLVGAANALPGSPLYRVKLASEDVWLWVAPARAEPALHLRFAQRRLEEYKELAAKGVHDETLLEAMVAQVDAALDGIEGLPPALALPLLDQVEEVVAEQRVVLSGMLADLPAPAKQQVDRILSDTFALIARVAALRTALQTYESVESPEGVGTYEPAGTSEPGQILVATDTPASLIPEATEEAVTPTSTEPSGGTQSTEATSAPPTETSVPSKTEVVATATPETPVEATPTKKTPPGLTNTAEPPAWGLTKTPKP
jgi:hypothetical protein